MKKLLVYMFALAVALTAGRIQAEELQHLRFQTLLADVPSEKMGNMVKDRDGFLWFSQAFGLAKYDGHDVTYYRKGDKNAPFLSTASLAVDNDGDIWILSLNNGLSRYDKESDLFIDYGHDPQNANSLIWDSGDGVNPQRLFLTRDQTLLIGTSRGFDMYDIAKQEFTHFLHDPEHADSLSENTIGPVMEDSHGMIWVGTLGGGLNRYDRRANTWTRYAHDVNNSASISGNDVWSLCEGEDGTLWVGTLRNGLNLFHTSSGTFTRYEVNPDDPGSIANRRIFHLMKDRHGNIWITHEDQSTSVAMEMYDPRTGEFLKIRHDEHDPYSISSPAIGTTFEDPDTGVVYIISSWGKTIDMYDPAGLKFTLYRHDPDNPDSLKSSATGITFEDSKGRIWVAAMGAMELFDRSTEKFTHFVHNSEDPNSLQGAYVAAFAETHDGMLWLLCQGGILTHQTGSAALCPRSERSGQSDAEYLSGWVYCGR